MRATLSLSQRATAWREVLSRPARFARHAGLVVVALACALVARVGTGWTRAGAAAGVAALLATLLVGWWLDARASVEPRRLVRQVIARTDRALGERALRVVQLMHRLSSELASSPAAAGAAGHGPGLALATFQFDKLIEGASLERVRQAARQRAKLYRWAGMSCVLVAVLVGVERTRELVEGADVLVAQRGRAPWPLLWTERLRVQAQPPAYLRAPARRVFAGATSLLPRGTQLTLRARPLFPNRELVVTDGVRETPFVSDGEGGLVAHYEVEADQSLVVAARFGDVLIPEPDALNIVALADDAPVVWLDGAPATQPLRELSRLELRWSAQDDHGLHQVDLVLRSGNREERRVLATYDDESARQQGGHVLLPTDPFFRSLFLPAQISIEARDNDPVGGSKWGKSPAITITPSAVGEPDAQRYLALVRARDAFVDALAVAAEPPVKGAAAKERLARFEERLQSAATGLEHALLDSYGGLRVPPGVRNFALGRLRPLRSERGPLELRGRNTIDLILALDGLLMSMSNRDAQRVAKILGNVAEEAMVGAQQAQAGESPAPGLDRLDKAIYALRTGAAQLLALGVLGNDLGSVALADLGRVATARAALDLYHAELAARHMTERLHRPSPSFGARGSGGVEAGQGEGSGEPQPGNSDAQQKFDELAQAIQDLVRQHSGAIQDVEQVASAPRPQDAEALRQEAERRALEIRNAVQSLPEPGNSPGTAEAAGALGRESARGMAHDLESLKLEGAVESARRAVAALNEARAKAEGDRGFQAQLDQARATVEEHQRWAQAQLDAQREAEREHARGQLEAPAALEEQLAGAAQDLARRGEERKNPLPDEVTDRLRQADQLMRQASRELARGEAEKGLQLQRDAQRLLENADQGKSNEGEGESPDEGEGNEGEGRNARGREGSNRGAAFGGDVPAAERQNRTEAFRRRVIQNLGDGAAGRLAPAVKRYAEGLLR